MADVNVINQIEKIENTVISGLKDFQKATVTRIDQLYRAVTGNILGAYLGLKSIPKKYLDNLELKDVILEIADDLYNDCKISEYGSYHDEIWEQKYIYKTYKRTKWDVFLQKKCYIITAKENWTNK